MSNLAADIVVPIRPDLRAVEKRVADTDDGYTRLANELYEELIGANLTRNQAKVAHAVCRKTYGFNKKMDRIADSQIAELTNLPRQKVNKAKNELILMRVLLKEGALIGPNKTLEEWQIPDCHQNGVTVTKPVTKSVTKTVTRVSPKQGHTKDTITKEKKDNINKPPISPKKSPQKFDPMTAELPEWLDPVAWSEWVQYRAESKKPINSQLTVTKAFRVLKECLDEGHDPTEVINTSIASSYQGLFKPKFPARKAVAVTRTSKPMNHIPEGFTG
ncbi:replication protein [Serratia marcescens]|uniref:replication protein n=1 Tax=Serratia marcescens TaxID=615 RepID=UPI0009B513D2|nr:replication protein [Serratia marcescens]